MSIPAPVASPDRCGMCLRRPAVMRVPVEWERVGCEPCAHEAAVSEAHDLLQRWGVGPGPEREEAAAVLAHQIVTAAKRGQGDA